jgi:salicylate hydroxylase
VPTHVLSLLPSTAEMSDSAAAAPPHTNGASLTNGSQPSSAHGPLKVIIAGGGIAGLSCAIALRRAGHIVHIYERSSMHSELGAAIHVPPNAARALVAWGLDPVRAGFVNCQKSFRANGETLEKFHVGNEDYIEERYGAPWWLTHRVDLHNELKRLAVEPEDGANGTANGNGDAHPVRKGLGKPATIHLRSQVTSFVSTSRTQAQRASQTKEENQDPEAPSITLKSGEVITGDLVVAADGIHTIGLKSILGHDNPPRPQDQGQDNFCYRFLIPADKLRADPVTRFWTEDDDGRMKFLVGKGKRIVSYPCRK